MIHGMYCDNFSNEMSLYYNPKTGLTVGKWVDDLIVRGQRSEQDKFWDILNKRFDITTLTTNYLNNPAMSNEFKHESE